MTEMKEERVPLSLYTPVKKTDTWKMASEFAEQWNAYSYQDAAWTDYASASPLTLSSTLYFRKTFVGLENMAAVELRVNYKFGVVAYINGYDATLKRIMITLPRWPPAPTRRWSTAAWCAPPTRRRARSRCWRSSCTRCRPARRPPSARSWRCTRAPSPTASATSCPPCPR